jgi:hypothetical protein
MGKHVLRHMSVQTNQGIVKEYNVGAAVDGARNADAASLATREDDSLASHAGLISPWP